MRRLRVHYRPTPSCVPSPGSPPSSISLGGSLLVATSLGAIAADLGPASVFVWTLIALIGVLQCLMIAEMAGMFPNKSGGTATYCHEAFKKYTPLVGAFSNWGYWFAWIPVIPVNMILVGGYIKASFCPAQHQCRGHGHRADYAAVRRSTISG